MNTEQEESEPLVITPRDVDVFRLIHEHRYSPYNQIRSAFWKDRSVEANSCYKRIERLVGSGYLEKGYSKRKSLCVYLLAAKGYEELKARQLDQGLELYQKTVDFDRNSDHDLKVLSVRILFRELGLYEWRSERVLKERDYLKRIPDGVLSVKGTYKIAVEFENYLKSKAKYREFFSYYTENKDYSLIFLIVDDVLKEWLIHEMKYDYQKVWFAGYGELLASRQKTLFENRHASFELSRICNHGA